MAGARIYLVRVALLALVSILKLVWASSAASQNLNITGRKCSNVTNPDAELLLASKTGNLTGVRLLLQCNNTDVNIADGNGDTALIWASYYGDSELVNIFLDHDQIDVNKVNHNGWSALFWVSYMGHSEVGDLLLSHPHIDINIADGNGDTALNWASYNGHVEIVKILLNHDQIEVNRVDHKGRSALYWASYKGHSQVVELLLSHPQTDVNIEETTDGFTALYLAAQFNYSDVTKVLLGHYAIDVNKRSYYGATPLHIASQDGHSRVVDLLLLHPTTDVNKELFTTGSTALVLASSFERFEVVKSLLANPRIDVDVNSQESTNGKTSLYIASQKGNIEIVKLLISHKKIHMNLGSNEDITPLMIASKEGHAGVVAVLLSHPEIDVNFGTWEEGKSALFFACEEGRTDVTKLLLQCPQTDINLHDENDTSALYHAKARNFSKIVHQFQSRRSLMGSGHTCCSEHMMKGLLIAAKNGDHEGAKLLLGCHGMDVNEGYSSGIIPLYAAARENHPQVVEVLLEVTDIDVNRGVNGENALLVAAEKGYVEVVKLLLSHPQIDANIAKRGNQGNALYFASLNGYSEIAKKLLMQAQIEVNLAYGSEKLTPLIAASSAGYLQVVKMLLRCPKTDVNEIDESGETALDKIVNMPDILQAFEMRSVLLGGFHTCCIDGNEELFKAAMMDDYRAIKGLAQCPNVNINLQDIKGRTPLYLASWIGQIKAVRELLNTTTIDVNKGRHFDGKTPLSIASEKGHTEVIELIIQKLDVVVNRGWFNDSWPSIFQEVSSINPQSLGGGNSSVPETSSSGELSCNADAFNCTNNSPTCIPFSWVCDGDEDCGDGSDEDQELCTDWTCGVRRYDCGNSDTKCIAEAQVCNDYPDCSDGSDEASQLCDCCDQVVVRYTENNTQAFQHHSSIFTTYKIESGTVNERSHYTSHNGMYALEYVDCGAWIIQSPQTRGLCFLTTGLAGTWDDNRCPNEIGLTWRYSTGGGGWPVAGAGLKVECIPRNDSATSFQPFQTDTPSTAATTLN